VIRRRVDRGEPPVLDRNGRVTRLGSPSKRFLSAAPCGARSGKSLRDSESAEGSCAALLARRDGRSEERGNVVGSLRRNYVWRRRHEARRVPRIHGARFLG
jgi:hypothetical protein